MRVEKRVRSRKYITKSVVLLIMSFLVVGMGLFVYQKVENNRLLQRFEAHAMAHHLDTREKGELHAIRESNEYYIASLYYPVFNSSKIDNLVKGLLLGEYNHFKESFGQLPDLDPFGRPIFKIDYNSFKVNDRFVSLYFSQEAKVPTLGQNLSKSYTLMIDLKDEKVLSSKDYFLEGFEEVLAGHANHFFQTDPAFKDLDKGDTYQSGILASNDNYQNIIVHKDKIQVIFNQYQLFASDLGQVVVDVAYSEIEPILKYDLNGNEIIVEPDVSDEPQKPNNEGRKFLAFTFDDGPKGNNTKRIVEAFNRVNGKATFFVLGLQVEQYPDVLKYTYDSGHQIGNHTFYHKRLTNISSAEIIQEIEKNNDVIENVIGIRPALVRPTYGATNEQVLQSVGYPMINWNIDSLDWKTKDTQAIINEVLANIEENGIIIMHDIYDTTAEAIEYLIPILHDQGYEFVTISELAERQGFTLEPNAVYRYFQ